MRPHVIVHMMSPLDGRQDLTRWHRPLGVALEDQLRVYERLHDELAADAWVVGSTTMRDFATASPHPPRDFKAPPRPLHQAATDRPRRAVALDRRASLHWAGSTANDDHVIVLLGAGVSDVHLAELVGDGVSYFVMENDEMDLAAALAVLAEHFGIRSLLIEGGGSLVGSALDARAVDEFSLVLCPSIDGTRGGSAIVEAGPNGLASSPSLTLTSHQEVSKGMLWVRYAVEFPARG